MKNGNGDVKRLGNENKDFIWILTEIGFYLFVGMTVLCAVVLLLLNVYLWWEYGLFAIVAVYALWFISRWGVSQLVSRPTWFESRPRLFSVLEKAHKVFSKAGKFLKFLHALHGRVLMKAGKAFMALPRQLKFSIAFASLAGLVPLSLLVTLRTTEIVRAKLPYGKQRFNMSSEELAARKINRIKMAKFAVFGKDDVVKSAECMDKYKNLLYTEARKQGLTPERVEGQLFVESFCDEDIINATSGAAGFGQLMLTVGCERDLVIDKAFCSKVLAAARTKTRDDDIKFIPKNFNIEDRRLNPDYAIPVAADIIGDAARYWGEENWAFVQYHMGQGNLRNLVIDYFDEIDSGWRKRYPNVDFEKIISNDPDRALPKEVALKGITFDDIFFRCTPDETPKTYKRLFSLADSSATYVYTGLAATEGFALMRADRKAFLAMVKDQQDPDGGSANRPMRAWWSNGDAKYKVRADIKTAAQTGELVEMQSSPQFGFVLRTKGADRIGECDPGNESSYYFTRKATAGLIYLLASRVKESGGDELEITGLIRTHEMYDKPVRKDGKGCLPQTQPRTHVVGVAFDIGARINGNLMSEKTRNALEFVLLDLRSDGMLDRIKEGTADHIAYNPDFEKDLEEVYNRVMSGSSPHVTSSPW